MTLTMTDRIKARILGSKRLLTAIAVCTAGISTQETSVNTATAITVAVGAGTLAYTGIRNMGGAVNGNGQAAVSGGGVGTGGK
jgi:hypothetical protein